jgi:hypothetical protein
VSGDAVSHFHREESNLTAKCAEEAAPPALRPSRYFFASFAVKGFWVCRAALWLNYEIEIHFLKA